MVEKSAAVVDTRATSRDVYKASASRVTNYLTGKYVMEENVWPIKWPATLDVCFDGQWTSERDREAPVTEQCFIGKYRIV